MPRKGMNYLWRRARLVLVEYTRSLGLDGTRLIFIISVEKENPLTPGSE
jgi:hypothetical protein